MLQEDTRGGPFTATSACIAWEGYASTEDTNPQNRAILKQATDGWQNGAVLNCLKCTTWGDATHHLINTRI